MRRIRKVITSKTTLEGAGVVLQRVFGPHELPLFDPFLLLDHFGSENPEEYLKGFPWHPHRGIETVTYMLQGKVEHADSMGNKGVINSGDIQWMTAGSGIIHQEMPQKYEGKMQGFQLWVNLPQGKKMTEPRYRGIKKEDVVSVGREDAKIKIIAGKIDGKIGPVHDLTIPVEYFDIKLKGKFEHKTEKKTVIVYVIEGSVSIGEKTLADHHCALLETVGDVVLENKTSARVLLIAADPLGEDIAWGGPIVMNTQEEVAEAFRGLEEGTFIKHNKRTVNPHEEYYQD